MSTTETTGRETLRSAAKLCYLRSAKASDTRAVFAYCDAATILSRLSLMSWPITERVY